MKRSHVLTQLLLTGVLIASLLAPAIASLPIQTPDRLHPHLAVLAAEAPNEMFRVMVQKTGTGDQAEALVESLGGQVTKDLYLINAFAAEVPGWGVKRLSRSAAVNWVSLDAPMEPATASPPAVRDDFNAVSFSNNDGLVSWEGSWIEDDAAGTGPSVGNVDIYNGGLRLDDYPNTNTFPSAAREVDLSAGVTAATFSFDFQTGSGTDINQDKIAVEVSSDGGNSYTVLEIFDDFYGNNSGSRSYDITPYISADTLIRFRVYDYFGGTDEYFLADNIQIEVGVKQNTYPDTMGIAQLHTAGLTGQGVTVAVVDSGVAAHPDFTGRLLTPYGEPAAGSTNPGDGYGHGTHVAGIVGGDGTASGGIYKGIAPGATILSVGVSDANGMAYESDVVGGLQWIFDNKDTYAIEVVNLSLNSTVEDSYNNSGIDAAAEILWFSGVVVVAAAGNTGANGVYNTAKSAPANDPYLIVVGASDEYDTQTKNDDAIASFSAYGLSLDNHLRPDLIAPGYNIYAALSPDSSWDASYPERVSLNEYFRLSGTSMSAPMVAGAVALLLEDEPNLTPDQIKYRLQNTATQITDDGGQSWPYLDVLAAINGTTTAEANQGLIPHRLLAKMAMLAYWTNQNGDENIDWENVDWNAVNWDSVNWDSVNWDSVNWDSVNWNSVNWNSVNWNSVNWNSVNWNSVNWNSVNWNSVNWNSVNWNSGGMGYLIAENGSRWVSDQPTLDPTNGLFWGELDRDAAPRTTCLDQPVEKGVSFSPICEGQFVIEK